jgi:hypothetical protein
MRTLLTGLALVALAGCSSGDEASAPPKADASGAAALPEDSLPEDATPDGAHKYLTSLTNPPQTGPWHPRDACVDLPGALEFREKLAAAVLARDADALVALSSNDVMLDFGGGAGAAEFKKRLTGKDDYLWKALQNLIPLGCAAVDGSLNMPWYFAQDIPVDDPYFAMMVKGVNVPVHDAPKADAKAIGQISWDTVELLKDPGVYAEVKLRDGKTGYIETAKLRSLIDYRLIAERRGEEWKITAFVAGD